MSAFVPTPAGDFNRRITIQRPSTPEMLDTFGQPGTTWITVGTFWAAITHPALKARAAEIIVAKQLKAMATHIFKLRYNPSLLINPFDQVLYTKINVTRTIGVVEVLNPDEANVEIWLYGQEVQTALTQE